MKQVPSRRQRYAIYTRKSTEHNLDLTFTSLDAQREACEAYIKSQAHEGWTLVRDRFDDGGLSGASLDRPALHQRRIVGVDNPDSRSFRPFHSARASHIRRPDKARWTRRAGPRC